MEVRRTRLTLGRLMAIIGITALGFAMSRVDATPAVSFCIFAGCSWYLASRRYAEALARRAAEGASIRSSQKARIAARCAIGAALAIGLPDAAFLGGYYGYMRVVGRLIARPTGYSALDLEVEPEHILGGALIGIAAALYVAAIMRRGLRPAAKKRIAMPTDRAATRGFVENGRIAAGRVSAC
jgi:hypothetical protein